MNWIASFILMLCAAASAQNDLFVVLWDRNVETNVIGYRVYWGGASREYYGVRDVGNETTAIMPGSVPIYLAVTAYDAEGLESGYSNEVMRKTNGPAWVKLGTPRFAKLTNTVEIVPTQTNSVDGVYFTVEATVPGGSVVATLEAFCPIFDVVGPVIFKARGGVTNLVRQPYTKALLKMRIASPSPPGAAASPKTKSALHHVATKKGKLEK